MIVHGDLPDPQPGERVEFVLARELVTERGGVHRYASMAPARRSEAEAWDDVKGRWPAAWHLVVLRREVTITDWELRP